jgi:hypothetical protein
MHITIKFDCDSEAFSKDPNLDPKSTTVESQRILHYLAQKLERWIPHIMLDGHEGYSSMTMPITDAQHKTIGTITISDGNPVDPEL